VSAARRGEEAELLDRAGAPDEARALAEPALAANDAAVARRATLLVAHLRRQSGDLEGANAVLDSALARASDEDTAGAYLEAKALTAIRAGRYADAAAFAREGLARSPSVAVEAGLRSRLGLAECYVGDAVAAAEILEQARATYEHLGE